MWQPSEFQIFLISYNLLKKLDFASFYRTSLGILTFIFTNVFLLPQPLPWALWLTSLPFISKPFPFYFQSLLRPNSPELWAFFPAKCTLRLPPPMLFTHWTQLTSTCVPCQTSPSFLKQGHKFLCGSLCLQPQQDHHHSAAKDKCKHIEK